MLLVKTGWQDIIDGDGKGQGQLYIKVGYRPYKEPEIKPETAGGAGNNNNKRCGGHGGEGNAGGREGVG